MFFRSCIKDSELNDSITNRLRRTRSTALSLLFLLLWNHPACADLPRQSLEVMAGGLEAVPVTVSLDRIGVLAGPGASEEQVARALEASGLEVHSRVEEQVYILRVPEQLSRAELTELARRLRARARPDSVIMEAGLLVTELTASVPHLLTDEVIVQLDPRTPIDSIRPLLDEFGADVAEREWANQGRFTLRASSGDALSFANRLNRQRGVQFAHPNFVRIVEYRQSSPNDPLFAHQWHLENSGDGGIEDADIDFIRAIEFTSGDPTVAVAVIDDGFDLEHPDLAANFASVRWDFTGCINTLDPNCGDPDPSAGFRGGVADDHGTSVAGAVGAIGNNGVGVIGTCPSCSIIPIRQGHTFEADALAIEFAVQQGASVISNSWGYPSGVSVPPVVRQAIESAAAQGVLVVFASSTTGSGYTADCGIPADVSSLPGAFAVGASNHLDQRTPSGYGNCIDVLAPSDPQGTGGTLWAVTTDRQGSDGYSTGLFNGICQEWDELDYTRCFGGTSFSAPLVSGVAGLMLSARPDLTRDQLQRAIQDTADRIQPSAAHYDPQTGFSQPPGPPTFGYPLGSTHGYGRINAFEAVRLVSPVSDGGRGGVDIFLRDHDLDWGNTEQASEVLFESPRGIVVLPQSPDIKVDSGPLFQQEPATPIDFSGLIHEDTLAGESLRVYVRVRNRGPLPCEATSVSLYMAFASGGRPQVASDFWSAFPSPSADPDAAWQLVATQELETISYSGASIANSTGEPARVVRFDLEAPTLDPSVANQARYALMAIVDSPDDPVRDESRMSQSTSNFAAFDNNIAIRDFLVRDLPNAALCDLPLDVLASGTTDLAIELVDPVNWISPAPPAAGTDTALMTIIKNVGQTPIDHPVHAVLCVDGVHAADWTWSPIPGESEAFLPGESRTWWPRVTLPSGPHDLRLIVNPEAAFAESDYSNNTLDASFTWLAPPELPDLAITKLWSEQAYSKGPAGFWRLQNREPVEIQVEFTNTGGVDITQPFFVSLTTPFDQSGATAGSVQIGFKEVQSLAAGATGALTITSTPRHSDAGDPLAFITKTFTARVDTSNTVQESDEGNNERTLTYEVVAPDLTVESIEVSDGAPYTGDSLTLTALIRNQGNNITPQKYYARLYGPGLIQNPNIKVQWLRMPLVPVGQSREIKFELSTTHAGTCTAHLHVHPTDLSAFFEPNFANNNASIDFTIQQRIGPTIDDFTVGEPTTDSAELSWTVLCDPPCEISIREETENGFTTRSGLDPIGTLKVPRQEVARSYELIAERGTERVSEVRKVRAKHVSLRYFYFRIRLNSSTLPCYTVALQARTEEEALQLVWASNTNASEITRVSAQSYNDGTACP